MVGCWNWQKTLKPQTDKSLLNGASFDRLGPGKETKVQGTVRRARGQHEHSAEGGG